MDMVIMPYGDNGAMAVVLMMTIEVIGTGGLHGESDNDVNGLGTAGSGGPRSFTDLSAGSFHGKLWTNPVILATSGSTKETRRKSSLEPNTQMALEFLLSLCPRSMAWVPLLELQGRIYLFS